MGKLENLKSSKDDFQVVITALKSRIKDVDGILSGKFVSDMRRVVTEWERWLKDDIEAILKDGEESKNV